MTRSEGREEPDVLTSIDGSVGIVTINRRHALNAMNYAAIEKIADALEAFDQDPQVRAIVLTGGKEVFAAGADIREFESGTIQEMVLERKMLRWDRIRRVAKPILAAVSGYALGGGCELALACDIVVASDTAVFAQPEVNLGVIPGAGGTQRLIRAVGKAVAMDMILSARRLSAQEALQRGLVSRVYPVDRFFEETVGLAKEIAAKPHLAVLMAKDCVTRAPDMNLDSGLDYERKLFYLLFGTEDQKEGMKAFRERRPPEFKGR